MTERDYTYSVPPVSLTEAARARLKLRLAELEAIEQARKLGEQEAAEAIIYGNFSI